MKRSTENNVSSGKREVCVLTSIKIYSLMQALKCIFFFHTFSQLHIFNASRIFRTPAQPRLTRSARSTAVDFLKLIAVARSGFFWPQISQKMWLAPFLPHTPTQSPWRASYFTQFITVEREITSRHVTVSRSACEVVTRSQVCRRIRSSQGSTARTRT